EAAEGWLRHGFDVLGMPRIISTTDIDNVKSLGVMKRLGMTFDHAGELVDDGLTFDAVVYAITAEEYRQRNLDRESEER
ncbi:MAG TPA: GNAT family protein, partial [Actinomycetes bacterium]|nr:GNAT family protein [Actinomycetes bacterium]